MYIFLFFKHFFFIIALLKFLEILEGESHDKAVKIFKSIWTSINNNNWIILPEVVIVAVIKSYYAIIFIGTRFMRFIGNRFGVLSAIIGTIFLYLIKPNNEGLRLSINFAGIIILFILLKSFLIGVKERKNWANKVAIFFGNEGLTDELRNKLLGKMGCSLTIWCIYFFFYYMSEYFKIFIEVNFQSAFLGLLGFIPLLWHIIITVIIDVPYNYFELEGKSTGYSKETQKKFMTVFGFTFCVSIALTIISLHFGHFLNPSTFFPINIQLIMSNFIFDLFTINLTFIVLIVGIKNKGILRIPLMILIDLVIAAFLACCSIYFAFIFTSNKILIKDTFNLLIGKTITGDVFELGPIFWVMHTTFIPTLIWLGLIFLAWIAKIFVIPINWFFGKSKVHKNPLKLSQAFLGIFSAFSFFLSYLFKMLLGQH